MLDQTVSDGLPRGVFKISGIWAENPGLWFLFESTWYHHFLTNDFCYCNSIVQLLNIVIIVIK